MGALDNQNLIFLPGLDGTGISFEPLAEALPRDVRVQIVRYPADRLLSFDQTVDWAAAQIRSDEASIVLAESFSGPVAVMLAASGRVKAKALILCATFARSPRPILLQLSKYFPVAAMLEAPWPRSILKHILEGGQASADTLLTLWQRIKPEVPAQVLIHRLDIIHRLDVRPGLARLTMPCLYIQATGDRTVPAAALADFTAAVPNLQVARIKGPHFILQARPRQSISAIESFMTHMGKFKEAP